MIVLPESDGEWVPPTTDLSLLCLPAVAKLAVDSDSEEQDTAEENAQRSFERNGATFGAKSTDDYVAKVHAFVSDPPKGAQTLKRANGDLLIYDPKGNVFAVVSRDGAPRTMFKPDEGASYWDEQKDRENKRASAAKKRDEAEG